MLSHFIRARTLQNETPSLEIRSEVGESKPQGMLAESAVWGTEYVRVGPWCEREALPPFSSGEGSGPPMGINAQPTPLFEAGGPSKVAEAPGGCPVSPQTHTPRVSGALFICWVPPAHLAVVGAETLPSVSSGAKEIISGSSDKCSGDTKTP